MSPKDSGTRVFYTDGEFEDAFGTQAAQATHLLGKYAAIVCRDCHGECCQRIACEFHSVRFPTCPIFDYRPAKCRLYFCDRILENEALSQSERDILNQPAKELSDALRRGWGIGIFIEPPVRVGERSWLAALGIEVQVTQIIRSLEEGSVNPDSARTRLVEIVERCRGSA